MHPFRLVLVVGLYLFGGAVMNAVLFSVVVLPFWLLRRVQHLHREGKPAAALLVLVAQLGVVSLFCAVLSPWRVNSGTVPGMPGGPGVGAGIAGALLYLAWFGLVGAEIIGLAMLASATQRGRPRRVILSLLGALGCGYGAWMVGGCPGLPRLPPGPQRTVVLPAEAKTSAPLAGR